MNVLILVLSARRDPWGAMLDCSMETWDSVEHPQTRTIYYCGKKEPSNSELVGVFYSPQYDEELERVAPRTMEAYEKSLELEWDFMARTHSSTYVHKRNLVEFCETLPRMNLLSGLLVTGEKPFLWGGGSYIMSRDVVEQLVENKQHWNNNIMEDNSLTDLANQIGIPFAANGRMASIDRMPPDGHVTAYGVGEGFDFSDWSEVSKLSPHYYVRCKQDLERHKDLEIFRKLHEYYK